MNASRSRVLAGYRRLFRARKELFDGDDRAMRESRVAIRSEFHKNRMAENSGPHFEGLLTMIDEAEDMLRTGFVRGELNTNTGRYRKCNVIFIKC
jgi:complex III assembly factor LYRM7